MCLEAPSPNLGPRSWVRLLCVPHSSNSLLPLSLLRVPVSFQPSRPDRRELVPSLEGQSGPLSPAAPRWLSGIPQLPSRPQNHTRLTPLSRDKFTHEPAWATQLQGDNEAVVRPHCFVPAPSAARLPGRSHRWAALPLALGSSPPGSLETPGPSVASALKIGSGTIYFSGGNVTGNLSSMSSLRNSRKTGKGND